MFLPLLSNKQNKLDFVEQFKDLFWTGVRGFPPPQINNPPEGDGKPIIFYASKTSNEYAYLLRDDIFLNEFYLLICIQGAYEIDKNHPDFLKNWLLSCRLANGENLIGSDFWSNFVLKYKGLQENDPLKKTLLTQQKISVI